MGESIERSRGTLNLDYCDGCKSHPEVERYRDLIPDEDVSMSADVRWNGGALSYVSLTMRWSPKTFAQGSGASVTSNGGVPLDGLTNPGDVVRRASRHLRAHLGAVVEAERMRALAVHVVQESDE